VEGLYHLDVLVHSLCDMLDIDASRILLHALGENGVRGLHLGKKGLNTRQNWERNCEMESVKALRYVRSKFGLTGKVDLSPKSN